MLWIDVTTAETKEWRASVEGSPLPAQGKYLGDETPRSVVAINLYNMEVRTKSDGVVDIYALTKSGDGLEIVYGPFPDGQGGLTRVVVNPPHWEL